MDDMVNTVRGKVFMHPVTKEGYGPIRLPLAPTNFSTLNGTSFDALAEDSCGNYFTTRDDGTVCFWDHETDDLVPLASSIPEFVAHCMDPPPVELDPSRVKSAWINPTFAESLGKEVPKDGWVKKPVKRSSD
jgi:hypothetical protein